MKTEHTPGPWKSVIHEGVGGCDYIQILAGSWDIAHNKHSARDWEEEKANARLIAAAAELLAACKAMYYDIEVFQRNPGGHSPGQSLLRAHAAIAKAEGGQTEGELKPSDFLVFPCGSVSGKTEYECVARKIMRILARLGDNWQSLTWEQYVAERKKDGDFQSIEVHYFAEARRYCENAETAVSFSPAWDRCAKAEGGQ